LVESLESATIFPAGGFVVVLSLSFTGAEDEATGFEERVVVVSGTLLTVAAAEDFEIVSEALSSILLDEEPFFRKMGRPFLNMI